MPYLTRWSMLSINCLIALRKGNIWNVFLTGKYIVRLQNPTSSTTYWCSLYLVSHGRIQEPHWFHKLLQWEWSCGGKNCKMASQELTHLSCRWSAHHIKSRLRQKLAKSLHIHPILFFECIPIHLAHFKIKCLQKLLGHLSYIYKFHCIRKQHVKPSRVYFKRYHKYAFRAKHFPKNSLLHLKI